MDICPDIIIARSYANAHSFLEIKQYDFFQIKVFLLRWQSFATLDLLGQSVVNDLAVNRLF
jgi:hypothetical protein